MAWLVQLYSLERSLVTAPRHPSGQRATQLGQDVEVGFRVRDQGVGACGGSGLLLWSSRDRLSDTIATESETVEAVLAAVARVQAGLVCGLRRVTS